MPQLRPRGRCFQLPGGGIDLVNAPLPTLHREVMEEILGGTIAPPGGWGRFRRLPILPSMICWAEKIPVYVAHPASGSSGHRAGQRHGACYVGGRAFLL